MENASKALIIAGAILLSILLISLGIMIFNQAQDTVTDSGMSQAEITAFNNKFLKYEGTQSASVTKTAISEVLASSADSGWTIPITLDNTSITTTSAVENGKNYTIAFDYSNGVVSSMAITTVN